MLEARKPGASVLDTESGIGFQMMRVNSLSSLISKITGHLRERSAAGVEGTVCLVCVDDGDAVTITLRNGDAKVTKGRSGKPVELTRRELTRLIFGPHPAGEPVTEEGEAGEVLDADLPVLLPSVGARPLVGGRRGYGFPRTEASRYCLSGVNFTPILTFPHQEGRDFQAPIRGYAKVSLRGNDEWRGFG